MENRDAAGRLMPGHKGLKPKGANNRLQGEIKDKITQFLSGELQNLDTIYAEVSAKDKLRFLGELLSYVLPKSKELSIETNIQESTAYINWTALSNKTLSEVLKHTKIDEHETEV